MGHVRIKQPWQYVSARERCRMTTDRRQSPSVQTPYIDGGDGGDDDDDVVHGTRAEVRIGQSASAAREGAGGQTKLGRKNKSCRRKRGELHPQGGLGAGGGRGKATGLAISAVNFKLLFGAEGLRPPPCFTPAGSHSKPK